MSIAATVATVATAGRWGSGGGRGRRCAAGAAVLLVLAIVSGVEAAPETVALVAAPGSRLADELARELTASSLEVIRIEVSARLAETEALAAAPTASTRAVFIAPDERGVTVLARPVVGAELHTRIELRVDSHNRVGRRRACLAVVEYLRVLAEAEGGSELRAAPAEAGPVPPPAAGVSPMTAATDNRSPAAVAAGPGVGLSPGSRRPWIMGVATTLDLNTALGATTGHLSFIWHFALGSRFTARVLAMWPLLGAQFNADEGHIRMWTFGGAAGVQYGFVHTPGIVPPRIRPFVGIALGTRLTLIETSSPAALPNSPPGFTPSVGVGVQVGLAYQVGRFVQLFVESGATRYWLLPNFERQGTAHDAASALSLNSSVGVMLEY